MNGGYSVNIQEKISLYEYCRTATGKSYYNLTVKRKEAIKQEHKKLKDSGHPAVSVRMN
jgi:hypothetical protein